MTRSDKLIFSSTMSLALAFGFLHVFIPDFAFDFDRLHIFLFNLCAGGSILLFYCDGGGRIAPSIYLYFGLTLFYAVSAFFELYWLTLILSVPLIALVERTRIRRFSFFPFAFFQAKPTSDKFLQASMLCLSLAITFCALVITNNEYLQLFMLEKLTIDVFFLGYSFPLSLLTFSVMYSFMDQEGSKGYMITKEISFWSITLGVVFFFVFIIFEMVIPEIIISNTLLAAVILTYYIYIKHVHNVQQKWILSSGMMFLVVTGITGVLYLFEYLFPSVREYHDILLMLHATVALYGWNLSGLFCVVRQKDFPIFNRIAPVIFLHWLTVMVLAPLGKYSAAGALVALPAYMVLVGLFFFRQKPNRSEVI